MIRYNLGNYPRQAKRWKAGKEKIRKPYLFWELPFLLSFSAACPVKLGMSNCLSEGWAKNERLLSRWFPLPGDHDSSYHCCLGSCGLSSPTVPSGLVWLQEPHGMLTLDLQAPLVWWRGRYLEAGQANALLPKLELHLLRLSDSLNELQNQQLIVLCRVFACLGPVYVTGHAMMLASIHPSFLSIILGILGITVCRLLREAEAWNYSDLSYWLPILVKTKSTQHVWISFYILHLWPFCLFTV